VPDEIPDGWYVLIQRSITRPLPFGGVPFGFAVLNGTVTLALTLGGQMLWFALVGLGIHLLGVAACKRDPYIFDVLREHVHTKRYYHV